ncbi:MAG TPA: ABC transporter permease [Ignavibacteriales bacterium]|nr:ABC transporter permease [Ignavibacteriales bacterium]HOL81326.1 ABC transporter permease [Ignavibacteriales bacterium]HPP33905.1 ABC transporter permease [Ignavibacteriales bacterium]HRR18464.1 ABC transporter permease [Ignavibacteriales bacterium]HRT99764.1 ABC transporter permease [Ignavibacteriales bacterium]
MDFNRILVIIKRELKEKLLSKAFIISTIAFPALFIFIGWFQFYLNEKSETPKKILVFVENNQLRDSLTNQLKTSKYENLTINISNNYDTPEKIIPIYKNSLLNDNLTGILFISQNSLNDKNVNYYSKYSNDEKLFRTLENILNTQFIFHNFSHLNKNDLNFIKKKINFKSFKVSYDDTTAKDNTGNLIVGMILSFLLYFSLLMTGSMIMSSIVEEKANRIVEIILSSVKPIEFLTGKIIGNTLTSLIQMAIWISPIIIVQQGLILNIPKDIIFSIDVFKFVYFLLNFAVGLITFVGLFAAVGSMYDNPQDAQNGVWPLTLLIMIPFFIAISLSTNPTSEIGFITSFIPFTSIIVMPVRMNVVEVPYYQVGISFVINVLTAIFVFVLSAKIYKIGIMITGKKPSFKDLLNWLKA